MKNRILILDDDHGLAKSIAKDFHEAGYETETAESSLQINYKQKFDFAVVDLRLSGGEFGLNVIDKILESSPKCKIIVLSGYGSITTAVEAVKRGAIDYLTKPASFEDIKNGLLGKRSKPAADFKTQSLSQVEHEYIDFILTKNKGNISKSAKELGLHRQSLQRKLKKYI
jgi:two-component system response regulator RegA